MLMISQILKIENFQNFYYFDVCKHSRTRVKIVAVYEITKLTESN